MQEGGDKAHLKELSWKISVSSATISVFFVSLIAFYLSNLGWKSFLLAFICAIATFFLTRKAMQRNLWR
ncbi:MAG: hypothetical protein QXO16_04850 [Archaeoglobaceae archaeon]